MIAATSVVPIELPRAEVFDYLANRENLPGWLGDADTAVWETVRIVADARTGVVDIWWRGTGAWDAGVLPVRILDTHPARCVVTVTCFEDRPNDAGEAGHGLAVRVAQLDRRLAELPERIEGQLRRA